MNKIDALDRLKDLRECFRSYETEVRTGDLTALNVAIEVMEKQFLNSMNQKTAPEVPVQEQSKFVPETSEGVCKNPNEHTTPVNIENQEARKILEEQFKLLSKESKRCDHKCLHNITNAMLNIYATLYPCQYDSKEG